jgi:hypothetical protein
MVRAALVLASTASALEPTGLLQATVGLHSHLSAGSDKVSSLKRMEKEWQAAAKKGSRVADDVLKTVYDSMQDILNDTETIFGDIQASVDAAVFAVTAANTKAGEDHAALMSGTNTDEWVSVCDHLAEHATCRGVENDDCSDRDDECDDKDTTLTHCAADNPLCNCASMDNSAETMKACLESAKAWYDNYHAADSAIPSPAPRGYFLGGLGASETRCNLVKEADECTAATGTCNDKKSECDTVQTGCQLEFCGFNTMCTNWCTNYGTEYATAIDTFNSEMEVQLSNDDSVMNNNLDVCFSVKKVACYLNVIANKGYPSSDKSTDRGTTYDLDVDAGYSSTFKQADGDLDGSGYDYDFCLAYTPTCDNLVRSAPTAPGPVDCSTYGCSTTIAANGLPEASTWFDAYYKNTAVDCSHNVNFYLDAQPESLGASC